MDIFKFLGITDEFGNPISENNLNPLIGYQIENKHTNRILPHTQRHEVMGSDFATKKLKSLAVYYRQINEYFPFDEYEFVPIYMSELESTIQNFVLLYTDKDEKEFGLFK